MQTMDNSLTPRQKKANDLLSFAEESGFDIVVRDQITGDVFKKTRKIDYQPINQHRKEISGGYKSGNPLLSRNERRNYASQKIVEALKKKESGVVQIPLGPYTGRQLQASVSSWVLTDSKKNNYKASTHINKLEQTLDVTLIFPTKNTSPQDELSFD